jgi:hypothetical protein
MNLRGNKDDFDQPFSSRRESGNSVRLREKSLLDFAPLF